MNDMLRVGAVIKRHGVRGEVKVWPTTDDIHRFDELSEVVLKTPSRETKVSLEEVKYFKNIVILKLSGIDSMDEAEKLRGADLYVERADAVPLSEGEYYIGDIIGMKAVTEDGMELGIIRDVIDTAANDVYAVRREGRKDLLIPAIKQCIKAVDLERNVMTVHLIDGLLDL